MTKFVRHTHGLEWTVHTAGFIRTPDMGDWCDEWFEGVYSNTFMSGSGTTVWFFQNRKEAIWFALTWT